VSAKDKATGKEQKIVIKASSGLSEDEIKRMVADAEAHAAEDKKFRELVESRNRADAMVHATEKSLSELGDKVSGGDRAAAESALSDLKSAIKGDDKEQIDRKAEQLAKASQGLMAAAQQAAGASAGSPDGGSAGAESGGYANAGKNDDVVDAEFEEVKDKKGGNA
jgi:molecular chaperone DnaK